MTNLFSASSNNRQTAQQLNLFIPDYSAAPILSVQAVPRSESLRGDRYWLKAQQGKHFWILKFQFSAKEIRRFYPDFEDLDWTLDLDCSGAPCAIAGIWEAIESLLGGGQ